MTSVTCNVPEIDIADRRAIEHLIGAPLSDHQQVVIRVVDTIRSSEPRETKSPLPDWCNVYDGLSDVEIAELEKVILTRADLSRAESGNDA